MFIIDVRNVDSTLSQDDAISRISVNGPRISAVLWGALDEAIITGHEDGEIKLWDMRASVIHYHIPSSYKNEFIIKLFVIKYNMIDGKKNI